MREHDSAGAAKLSKPLTKASSHPMPLAEAGSRRRRGTKTDDSVPEPYYWFQDRGCGLRDERCGDGKALETRQKNTSIARNCIDFLPSFAADRVGEQQRGGPQTWAKNAVSETATESRGYGD